MTALIVGLGSMGKRRARLLKAVRPDIEIIGVDNSAGRREEAEDLGIKTYPFVTEALAQKPYCAFVCTAPLSHNEVAEELLEGGCHVFCELNLVDDGYEVLTGLAAEKSLTLFLSSTMLYRKEIQYMAKRVRQHGGKPSYIYHIGQYLPDWHPWESYKNFFVSDKRTNGCREIFGIEMPWLVDTFGPVTDLYAVKDKVSELHLDYPDRFFVTLTHQNGVRGQLAVDLVCPKPVRNLEIFAEGLHLFWEGSPTSLSEYNVQEKKKQPIDTYGRVEHDKSYSDNVVENAYADEILNFLEVIEGREQPLYSFAKDKEVLAVIDRIEA